MGLVRLVAHGFGIVDAEDGGRAIDREGDRIVGQWTDIAVGNSRIVPLHHVHVLSALPFQALVQPDVNPELNQREAQILKLMALELPNDAISEQLGISLKTVRNHVSNICTKLQVSDRSAAILRALQ